MNFANNHSVGGSPFSAGAQEESLCRTSTLYECLSFEYDSFYKHHHHLYSEGLLTEWGNDDLIYSPDIVVFKTDSSAPEMMEQKDWYKVDVITCAAPELRGGFDCKEPDWMLNFELKRLKRVFQIAKQNNVDVLILGAWGCGAFKNPPDIVATAFAVLCKEYRFDVVEFAIDCSRGSTKNYDIFKAKLSSY